MIFDEIWRMQRRERKMARAYYREVESLRKEHKQTEEQIDMLMNDKVADLNTISTSIEIAQSNALVEEARNLKLPLPPHSDKDTWTDFFGPDMLTPKGYADLRSRVRQERKERRETMTAIVKDIISPLGSLLISILSLLIAYAALKLKH